MDAPNQIIMKDIYLPAQKSAVQLRVAQLDILYDQTRVTLAASIAAGLFLVFIFWSVAESKTLASWFLLLLTVSVVRASCVIAYQRSGSRLERTDFWLGLHRLGLVISGGIWGVSTLLLPPEGSLVYTGITLLWICGLAAGSVAALAVMLSAFFAFVLPALIPSALFLILSGDTNYSIMGGGLLMFLGFLSLNAWRMHKTLINGLCLQLENRELVTNLESEKDRVEKLNDMLEKRVDKRTRELRCAVETMEGQIAKHQLIEKALRESEERFQLAMLGANDGVWDWDLETDSVYFSPRWKSMLGYEDQEIVNRFEEWQKRAHPDDIDQAMKDLQDNIEGRTPEYVNVHRLRHKDGDYRWILDRGRVIRDKNGRAYRMVGTHVDITDRKAAEDKLRQAAAVFENTAEGVLVVDDNAYVMSVNPAFTEITAYTQEEIVGKSLGILYPECHQSPIYAEVWANVLGAERWQGEIWGCRSDGELFPQWLTISGVKDENNEISSYVAVFSDITSIKDSQAQLELLAHHDSLTGLPNRVLFNERLHHALQRANRENTGIAVLFIDLDRFKNINDSLGHTAGDQLLERVAKRLRKTVRDEDTVARLGGDEFTILLEDVDSPQAIGAVAQKILETISRQLDLNEHEVHVSGSIGISLYPEDGKDVTTLLKNADNAMYRAKEKGRNNYQFYTKELTAAAFERFAMESSLRQALRKGEFELYYQMQMSAQNEQVMGAEALVRWKHPLHGMIAPSRFIPLTEETGLIIELGEWVLRSACRQARQWQDNGLPEFRLAVNISTLQITHGQLAETVQRILEETGLEPQRLELELTEGMIMQQTSKTMRTLNELRRMGVTLAVDDFGTGYSSLSYLKRLPIQRLKIDQSFVNDITSSSSDKAITRAIIVLAKSLQMTAIAEGVENSAQLEVLRAEHCDEVQGWLYGEPEPAAEFSARLHRYANALSTH